MDYPANLHHQLLQLEDQFLVGVGSSHAWSPNVTMSSGCGSEPNFQLQDLDSQLAAIDAESFASLQYTQGKDQKSAGLKEEASVSSTRIAQTLNGHSTVENLKKNTERCYCSKIYPTIDISSRNLLLPESSNSMGFGQNLPFASHHQLQHSRTSCRLPRMPQWSHEITQAKRPCTLKQQKPTQATSKKTRVEPRATCPQLKIRKEKLGDRIAALQQLVAPFGKTDTASVLMEAISYINFLQNQVEILSHSYMKSYHCKNYKTLCRDKLNDEDEEPSRDLKARGLCLVPLACISYLPEDIGGGGIAGSIWPPLTNFNWGRF